MQEIAWSITLVLMLVVIATFIYVVINSASEEDYEPVKKRFYAVRAGLFWLLVTGFIIVSFSSFQGMPYAAQHRDKNSDDTQVINAEGFQWYWKLSRNEVKANKPVVFNVTSADVNHGFGIYDETLRLLAQTQAMPGYVNKLEYTFKEPGTYKVLCMEYCGMAHHSMLSAINVVAE